LNGSLNQIIIVWLLYRTPRDLMKAVTSIIDRTLSLLTPVQKTRNSRGNGRVDPSR
jgi:hypothetical protein